MALRAFLSGNRLEDLLIRGMTMRRVITGLACLLAAVGTAAPAWAQDGTPDLGVTLAWAPNGGPHVRSGDTATWVVTVTNLGDATASAVEV